MRDIEESDLSTEMLRIGGDLLQGLRAGLEEEIIEHRLVLDGESDEFTGQGKHEVEVGHIEKVLSSSLHPVGAERRLALRAMAVPAGVARDLLVTALIVALEDMASESLCATDCEGVQDVPPLERDRITVGIEEVLLIASDDVGHFELWSGHGDRLFDGDRRQEVERTLRGSDGLRGDVEVPLMFCRTMNRVLSGVRTLKLG